MPEDFGNMFSDSFKDGINDGSIKGYLVKGPNEKREPYIPVKGKEIVILFAENINDRRPPYLMFSLVSAANSKIDYLRGRLKLEDIMEELPVALQDIITFNLDIFTNTV
jgi:hypothetical protein